MPARQGVRGLLTFMGDGAYDRAHVLDAVLAKNPAVGFIVSRCKGAVPGSTATTASTQRDFLIRSINEHGRINWPKTSCSDRRSKVEAAIGRSKRVNGDDLRHVKMHVARGRWELGRPICARVAR